MQRWKVGLGLVVAAVATAVAGSAIRHEGMVAGHAETAATPPQVMAMPVPVAPVVKKAIAVYYEYSARTEAIRGIALQPRISGYIQSQDAADGSDVNEGDLLYTIDPRDVQAALDQAKAQAQRDRATLEYARSNLNRGAALSRSGFIAKDTYDQRASASFAAEAALAMDEAAIRTAELNLNYAQIRAPFSGRLGRNQASIGTLVSPGGGALNTLVQLSPIYVTFNPSETELTEIQRARTAGSVTADILVPGSDQPPRRGELIFIDNTVDRSTGTIVARATITNADRTLLPGQYVRVRISLRELPDAMMVPQAALGSSQFGKYVYVVGQGSKVEQRLVSLGPTDGDLVAVLNGISEGDSVISGNLQKIGPGMTVQPLSDKHATATR